MVQEPEHGRTVDYDNVRSHLSRSTVERDGGAEGAYPNPLGYKSGEFGGPGPLLLSQADRLVSDFYSKSKHNLNVQSHNLAGHSYSSRSLQNSTLNQKSSCTSINRGD